MEAEKKGVQIAWLMAGMRAPTYVILGDSKKHTVY